MTEPTVEQREYIQKRLEEMVAEGRIVIVGMTEDGKPLYQGVPG